MATIPLAAKSAAEELQDKLDLWHWNGVWWERIHWLVGILGILFSALSAATNVTGDLAPVFAVAATICLGTITFANPQVRSGRFFRSYRMMDTALRAYRNTLLPLDELLKVHSRAEELLNDKDVG